VSKSGAPRALLAVAEIRRRCVVTLLCLNMSYLKSHACDTALVENSHLVPLGRMGRILGRFGTDVGTDKTSKIVNVYRPWDVGTDKLGGEKG